MSTRIRRVARKAYRCDDQVSDYCSPIAVGHAYLSTTLFPGQSEYAHAYGRPMRVRACVYCVARRQDLYLLEPLPVTQKFRYWETDSETPYP